MIYKSDKPYPTPKVENVNEYYALLLLENYAGLVSEDTAIHQYLFEYLMMNNNIEEFAIAMMHISEVEMHHLRLIGETIKLLGVMPIFGTVKNKEYIPWTSNNINYTIDIKEMLLNNIRYEKLAIEKYKENYIKINDKYIRKLIDRIIEDELIHIEIFEYFYKEITEK